MTAADKPLRPGDAPVATGSCGKLVRSGDPHLHATAMFAREPERGWLMVLYAFDIELSRAVRASEQSMIPQIRLQWWHDVVTAATTGKAPERHEVAEPLFDLIIDGRLDPELLLSMISGYARELDLPMSGEDLAFWAEERFAARLIQAAQILLGRGAVSAVGRKELPQLWRLLIPLGRVAGAAFAIEHAATMAARGQAPLMPDVDGVDRAALAQGELTETLRTAIARRADRYLRQIAHSRAEPVLRDRRIAPALLPLARAERVLEFARRPDFALGQLDKVDRPFDGLRLAWRSRAGRW